MQKRIISFISVKVTHFHTTLVIMTIFYSYTSTPKLILSIIQFFFFLLFPITGDTMLMNDLYGFENSLSNSDSSLNNGSSVNGSCYLNGNNTGNGMNIGGNGANIGNGCTPTSIGSGTPQINANSPSIPYSPLTPSSLSSSAFATPAKNFDALQVNNYSYTYI